MNMDIDNSDLAPADTYPPDTTTVAGGTVMPADTGSASTGFLLWGCALVFFMTPGLALFYSGLSKYNSALSLMYKSIGIHSFILMDVVYLFILLKMCSSL